jgi:4-amino-4-deoxy-L-arabinose transferase-like glycosyltransferase
MNCRMSSQYTPAVPGDEMGCGFLRSSLGSAKATLLAHGLLVALAAGIALRVLVVILGGNGMRTPWGGGGDTSTYLLLAHNLLDGKGYTYAGVPTALRPPAYPILLAAALKIFGSYALGAMRWLQFFVGLAVVFLCAALGGRVFGKHGRNAALVAALFSPTLVEMNGEILTESIATLFIAVSLYYLVRYIEERRWAMIAGLGIAIGFGVLIRFNVVLVALFAFALIVWQERGSRRWRGVAILFLSSLLIISPWLVRNLNVFHGDVLLSTGGGINAIQGVLTPQGRALPGDSDKLRAAVGWVPPVQIETNSPSRSELPAEPVLDRECWAATRRAWRQMGWRLVPLAFKKLSYFWLSTDQILWTSAFSPLQRSARAMGVIIYLGYLGTALVGWFHLRRIQPLLAGVFLWYAVVVTLFHLPFNMLTRYRMPFADPLIAVLAGMGAIVLMRSRSVKKDTAPSKIAAAGIA